MSLEQVQKFYQKLQSIAQFTSKLFSIEEAMSQETPSGEEAYRAGYQRGYDAKPSQSERFPGQEGEYCRGHRKGWQDGYMNQSRPFF